MIHVAALYVYPLKSCRGITVPRADVARRGFAHDRRWMIVDGHGRFVTQRARPRMALVDVAFEGEWLRVEAPGMNPIRMPLTPEQGEHRRVHVWNDECDALVDRRASEWFARFLGIECEAVYMPERTNRPVDPERGGGGAVVSFADGFPFLLTSEQSLVDLEHRSGVQLSMRRFRPNIVVRGAEAFAEDHWNRVRIGTVSFRAAAPCARCTIPTVDPDTASRGKEPLRTLASYRRRGDEVMFGVNLVHEEGGRVHVEDAVVPEG